MNAVAASVPNVEPAFECTFLPSKDFPRKLVINVGFRQIIVSVFLPRKNDFAVHVAFCTDSITDAYFSDRPDNKILWVRNAAFHLSDAEYQRLRALLPAMRLMEGAQ